LENRNTTLFYKIVCGWICSGNINYQRRNRCAPVNSHLLSFGDLRGAVDGIREKIESNISLPPGYFIEYGEQFESEGNAPRTMTLLSIISIIAILVLLYLEFGNFRQAILVMVNLPLALAADKPGSELQSPMAIVILGGLISATFLNLVVVPALFIKWGRKEHAV